MPAILWLFLQFIVVCLICAILIYAVRAIPGLPPFANAVATILAAIIIVGFLIYAVFGGGYGPTAHCVGRYCENATPAIRLVT